MQYLPSFSFLFGRRGWAAAAVLLLGLTSSKATAQALTFAAVATYGTGTNSTPYSIAVADVNGDGLPDLLTANQSSNGAGVMLGTGAGTFGAATVYPTGANSFPEAIEAADVNGDGKLDLLLTANSGANTVWVLLGTGTGTFGAAITYSTGANTAPVALAVADVNRDGRPDLLTANSFGNSVGVRLGTTSGTFGAVTNYPVIGGVPRDIAVADVNGDGRPDVLTANGGNSTIGVLLGTGTGSFGTATMYSTGAGNTPNSLAVADVNGDGKSDVVTSNFSDGVGVLLGTGTGTFGAASTYSTGAGSSPYSVAVADVNGDGKPDLVTANYDGRTAGVLLGTGTRSFGTVTTRSAGANSFPRSIAVADVNGDGRPDLLTANYGSSTAGVLLNTTPVAAPRGFLPVATYTTGLSSSAYSVAVADVNGDGRPDLLTGNYSSSGTVRLGTGTGTFGPLVNFGTGSTGVTADLVVADVNGDGRQDILTASGADGLAVLLGTGTGTFGAAVTFSAGAGSSFSLAVADVNRDGKLDILTNDANNNTIAVLLGTGTGSFGTATTYSTGAGSAPFKIALADMNGDGKLDVLTTNLGNSTIGVLLGTGTGSFGAVATFSTGAGTDPQGIAVADVNGDGKPDVLSANGGNRLGVLLGTGTGSLGTVTTFSTGAGTLTRRVEIADVNGDGRLDALTTNFYNSVGVLLGTGTGSFGTATYFGTGVGNVPVALAVADVNRDALPDLLTASTFGTAGVLLGTVTALPALTGISPASGPVGTSVTLTGSNLTGATAVTFSGTSNNTVTTGLTVSGTGSSQTITVAVPAGAATGGVTVTTPSGTGGGVSFTVTVATPPDLTVSAPGQTISGNYNNVTITSTGAATLGAAMQVAGTLTVQTGGSLLTACQPLTGTGSFVLEAGATLGICDASGISASGATGAVQLSGSRSFSPDASYVYDGTAAQATGNGLPAQVRELTVSTTTGNLTLTNDLAIAQVVRITTPDFNFGNLDLGGRVLTLRSSSLGTALLVNDGNGSVLANTGTCRMERYINPGLNAGAGYRHFSSPIPSMTIGQLATTGFTPVLTQAYNTSATPTTVTPFPNVFGYDQNRLSTATNNLDDFSKGWVVPLATTLMGQAEGYTVNLPATSVVTFSGTSFNQASAGRFVTPGRGPQADAGWILVGNPYPSPIDLSRSNAQLRINLDAATYVFESTSQYGGQYRAYLNGIGGNPLLAAGQGFFVRMTTPGQNAGISFTKGSRLTSFGAQPAFHRGTADLRPQVQLTLRAAALADVLYVYAETGATPGADATFDAVKLTNPSGLNLAALTTSGAALAIQGLPVLTAGTVVPLTVALPAAGPATFTAILTNLPAGLTAFLTDALTGTSQDLRLTPTYTFPASNSLAGRFALVFGPASGVLGTGTAKAATLTLHPNPARTTATLTLPARAQARPIVVLDALGREVRRATLPAQAASAQLEVADLPAGLYVVRCGTASVRLVVE